MIDDTSPATLNTLENSQHDQLKPKLRDLVAAAAGAIWIHPAIEVLTVPGKGAALRAVRPVSPNTELLRVRPKALLNISTVKPTGSQSFRPSDWTSHQLLAYFLASTIHSSQPSPESLNESPNEPLDLGHGKSAVLPSSLSLKESINGYSDCSLIANYLCTLPKNYHNLPLTWDLQDVPVELRARVEEQRATLTQDYNATCRLDTPHAPIPFELFQWAWLTVNTRCLYIPISPSHSSANLTLSPAIDLLNHTSDESKACLMKWDRLRGMTIYTGPKVFYTAGDEICITYGHHPNTFLAIEYGFAMENNLHDCVDLAPALPLPILSEAFSKSKNTHNGQKLQNLSTVLKNLGYYGDYTVSDSDPYISFRTIVAAVAISHPDDPRAVELLANGHVDESVYQNDIKAIVKNAILTRREQIKVELEHFEQITNDSSASLANTLYKNWLRILDTVEKKTFT